MKVNINNVLTLGINGYIITAIDGLSQADIRTSSFLFSGRDGGAITDQYLGFRNINVSGELMSDTCEQHQIDRTAFIEATPINTLIPIYITNFVGETYLAFCNVVKLTMLHEPGGQMSSFLLQLTAGDPLFYNTDGGDEQTALINRVEQGGYVTPYELPVDWASGSAPTIVDNTGDAIVYPVITLNDAAINPSITNQLTGETFALDMTFVDTDVVVIDMLNRTVTLNGSSIMGNKTDDSIWWGLLPGNNPIVLDSDSAGDTVTATLVWRNGRSGI